MGRTIAFANYKGGTGKTTSCLSIAGYLSKNGSKVLIIDLDSQSSATKGLGINPSSFEYSIYDCILEYCNGYEGIPIKKAIKNTKLENLDIVPAEYDLTVAELLLQRSSKRANILNLILEEVKPIYNFIFIDLSSSSGLLTMNGLMSADEVIIPTDPSLYSLETLSTLEKSFSEIGRLTGHSFQRISIILVRYREPNIFTDMFGSPNPSRDIESRLSKIYQSIFLVPESDEVYRSQKKGVPISHYAPRSSVGRAYEKIAKSVAESSAKKVDFANSAKPEETKNSHIFR